MHYDDHNLSHKHIFPFQQIIKCSNLKLRNRVKNCTKKRELPFTATDRKIKNN